MSIHSNIGDVERTLRELADCLDLTRGTGKDMLAHIAVKVSERAQDEAGFDRAWDENRGSYGKRKRAAHLPVGVGLKPNGTRMLSLLNIKGEQAITADSATMSFGVDDLSKRKAMWFTAGSKSTAYAERSGAKNQQPRPFYAMTEEDENEIVEIAGKAIETFIGNL